MTIGEHLEELRARIIRSLIGLVVGCIICIYPSKYLLELLARPVIMVLRARGQADSFLATSPIEVILVYIKVVVFFGLLLAAPYVLYQLWSFTAVGLYPREKAWVHRLVPLSVGLFVTGVLFMYVFVLIVSLNFLVGFANWLPVPAAQPNALERVLLRERPLKVPESQPAAEGIPIVPLVEEDPNDPPIGGIWFNVPQRKLKMTGPDERAYTVQVLREDQRALVQTHFKIGEYLTFLLIMTVAFGLAFQTPLVVVFLARTGIVPVETFRKYRKVVILLIVFIAGMLAPPDLLSHLLLSVPMIVLFETGLIFAARGRRAGAEAERET